MKHRGIVMITVMVVIALAAISAASLLYRMNAEVSAGAIASHSDQAAAAAWSGLQRAIAVIEAHRGEPELWLDNPELFRDQIVFDDGVERWCFTIYAPPIDDPLAGSRLADAGFRFGITDTAARLNLNFADEQALLALPGMTSDLVDALLDYRDRDADARANGGEQDHYSELDTPYLIKNGRFTSVEELLLVRGFTPAIVFGHGAARDAASTESTLQQVGLVHLLTTASYEFDRDAAGERRVDLNGSANRLENLGLSEQALQFIRLYRGEGRRFTHPSELLGMRYQLTRTPGENDDDDNNDRRRRRRGRRQSVALQEAPDGDAPRAGDWIEASLTDGDLAILLDRTTTRSRQRRRSMIGRVNVNTAPAEVLAAVPGLDDDIAQRIVSTRSNIDPASRTTIAWLYTEGLVDAEAFRDIAPRLTSRGYQYHVRVVGYGLPSGRYRVYEAIIDSAANPPRITYLRDLTREGLPLPIRRPET